MQDITRPCAHEALTRPRKLAIELWKQSWLLSLNRIRLQDGACAALIPSLYRSSTRCCRSGGMRSSRLSVWIHFSDNGPQFGYLETNDWIRGWSSVTHVGLRNDCLERKQSLASSDFAVKFSTNSWASKTLARQTICQVHIWKASCILLGLAISTASRIELKPSWKLTIMMDCYTLRGGEGGNWHWPTARWYIFQI